MRLTCLLPFVLLLGACAADRTVDPPVSPVAASADDDATCPAGDACALGLAPTGTTAEAEARSVTGAPLAVCSREPLTGFLRDGSCRTGVDDVGAHTVCGVVNAEFLAFGKERGNDLVTARGGLAGLVPGDRWCLCEGRVREALEAGVRVPIVLDATHAAALRTLSRPQLEALAALAGPRNAGADER
jgi:uncharacterized protein (DUF2237 family)